MVAGGASGAMTVWNLETQRLQTVVPAAHAGAITSLHFFPGEPRLLSAGADNRLTCAAVLAFGWKHRGWMSDTVWSCRPGGIPLLVGAGTGPACMACWEMMAGHYAYLLCLWLLHQDQLRGEVQQRWWHGQTHPQHLMHKHACMHITSTVADSTLRCSLRQWVFDSVDGSARLLKLRSGHGAPPSCVRYYNEGGTRLLSAGTPFAVVPIMSTILCWQPRCLRLAGLRLHG